MSGPQDIRQASTTCNFAAGGMTCGVEQIARSQLWWTVKQVDGEPGRDPVHVDVLRRWSVILIDAILAFHDDISRLPQPSVLFWQKRMALITEQSVHPVTGGIRAQSWLVHARHRTQTRGNPAQDRTLFRSWVPHLTAAVLDLIGQTAAAAAQTVRANQNAATAAHLLQARHNLQHACRELNPPSKSEEPRQGRSPSPQKGAGDGKGQKQEREAQSVSGRAVPGRRSLVRTSACAVSPRHE